MMLGLFALLSTVSQLIESHFNDTQKRDTFIKISLAHYKQKSFWMFETKRVLQSKSYHYDRGLVREMNDANNILNNVIWKNDYGGSGSS